MIHLIKLDGVSYGMNSKQEQSDFLEWSTNNPFGVNLFKVESVNI